LEVVRVLTVYCDGSCEPNPGGIAAFGWAVYDGKEKVHEFYSVACKGEGATNNVAEYSAVISALSWLLANGYAERRVTVHSDSELLVRQLAGKYRVKAPNLIPLHRRALELAALFREVAFRWVPREKNVEADALSQKARQGALLSHGRGEKARGLAPLVRHLEGGLYAVPSQSDPFKTYTVDLSRNTCDCPDFRARGKRLGYCKHILAVREFAEGAPETHVLCGS
jgi:ribonuclease HI